MKRSGRFDQFLRRVYDGRPAQLGLWLLAALYLLLMAWPLIAGAGEPASHPDRSDWRAVEASVLCALADMGLIVVLGTPVAWLLAYGKFAGKWVIELLVFVPLLTPPLAMGMLLITALGPRSMVGAMARHWDVSLTNSWPALILAGFYAASPFYVVGARVALESVGENERQLARNIGRGPLDVAWRITLPLARRGLLAALAIAWVRALGEFGIALMIAYFPHGMPVQMWVNMQDSGPSAAFGLIWLLLLIGLPVPLILGIWRVGRHGGRRAKGDPEADAAMALRAGDPAAEGARRAAGNLLISIHVYKPIQMQAEFELRGVTVLLGAVGAGKTTLLAAIAGLIPADGQPFGRSAPHHRPIGYLPQGGILFDHLTVEGNVAIGLADGKAVDARGALEGLGIRELAGRYPYELSGGQRQLAGLARALARRPALLLLDEPTAGLDAPTAERVLRAIRAVGAQTGAVALLASHDPHTLQYADECLVLDNRQIVSRGTPRELLSAAKETAAGRLLSWIHDFKKGI